MRNSILLILILTSALGYSQSTFVPDDNFEAYLEQNSMGDGILNNDLVLTENINSIEVLHINSLSIYDFTGLEDFVGLHELQCYFNNWQGDEISLDLSNMSELVLLNARGTNISSIVLPETATLELIDLQNNALSSIDVTNNPNLWSLTLSGNYLTDINVSNNLNLKYLIVSNNQISEIDLSVNILLESIGFSGNNISEINTSFHPILSLLNMNYNDLSELDVTSNAQLAKLYAASNQFISIDISSNPELNHLMLRDNNLINIDLSSNPLLERVYINKNELTELNVSMLSNLTELYAGENELVCLNIKNNNNTNFSSFSVFDNPELSCIQADTHSLEASSSFWIDEQMYFDTECECSSTVGINYLENSKSKIHVYPNPSNGSFNLNLSDNRVDKIQVYNSLGKEVKTVLGINFDQEVNLNNPPGIYHLNIHLLNGSLISKKLVIQ